MLASSTVSARSLADHLPLSTKKIAHVLSGLFSLSYNAPMNGTQKFIRGVLLVATSAILLMIGLAAIFVVLNATTWQEVFSWLWNAVLIIAILAMLCVLMAYLTKFFGKH